MDHPSPAPGPRLGYVVDPMCSWCYGFAPTLEAVRGELRPGLELELVAGGLAPDSTRPMDPDTRRYVQAAWHAVTERTGVEFDHSFWELAEPRRSTYPACRAMLAARREGLGWEFLAATQRAYYREARNPSDVTTLVELAVELGLDGPSFEAALGSAELEAELQTDLARARTAGATSFPSLIYRGRLVAAGCLGREPLRAALGAAGLLGSEPY